MPEHRYAVIVYWSARDAAYIAEAPELPGSAADGASSSTGRGDRAQLRLAKPTIRASRSGELRRRASD